MLSLLILNVKLLQKDITTDLIILQRKYHFNELQENTFD